MLQLKNTVLLLASHGLTGCDTEGSHSKLTVMMGLAIQHASR